MRVQTFPTLLSSAGATAPSRSCGGSPCRRAIPAKRALAVHAVNPIRAPLAGPGYAVGAIPLLRSLEYPADVITLLNEFVSFV